MPALVAKNGHPEYWKKIDRNGEEGLGRRCNMDDHGPLHTLSKVANGTGSLHTRATFTSKNIRMIIEMEVQTLEKLRPLGK